MQDEPSHSVPSRFRESSSSVLGNDVDDFSDGFDDVAFDLGEGDESGGRDEGVRRDGFVGGGGGEGEDKGSED